MEDLERIESIESIEGIERHADVIPHPPKQRASARGLLLVSLSRFYSDERNMATVLPYVTGNSAVSLRLIDWFVTNYSKKYNVYLNRRDPLTGETSIVNVYQSYRCQLKAYSKQQFDPFRRRDRILFCYTLSSPPELGNVETTVGQLNFFRWMLLNGILEYVSLHAVTIEADMVTWQRSNNPEGEAEAEEGEDATMEDCKRTAPGRTMRSELSASAPNLAMMRMGGARTLAFE